VEWGQLNVKGLKKTWLNTEDWFQDIGGRGKTSEYDKEFAVKFKTCQERDILSVGEKADALSKDLRVEVE